MIDQLPQSKTVPLNRLHPHPENPRIGDIPTIIQSLQTHGQYQPLIVQAGTNRVIAGNHTLKGMLDLGWEKGQIIELPVTDEQAKQILLIDNRASDNAGYDEQQLLATLQRLEPAALPGTGYTDADVAELARLTGHLGHQNSAFLDDLRGGSGRPAGDGETRNHFELQFPVTEDQRRTVLTALQIIQDRENLPSSVEALEHAAREALGTT